MRKATNRFVAELQDLREASQDARGTFGLMQVKENASVYGLSVVMQNDKAGVQFEFSPREGQGWGAVVGRIIDGSFPQRPMRIYEGIVLSIFDIRDVATLRLDLIPELAPKIVAKKPLSVKEVCEILQRCCGDILTGDFSLFPSLSNIVMERARSLSSDGRH